MKPKLAALHELPITDGAKEIIEKFLITSIDHCKENLISIILFGSAAEKKLRQHSDINLLFVLKSFQKEEVEHIRDLYRTAHAAAKVSVMFVLESELDDAASCFPVKFFDIHHRHILIHGEDVISKLEISPEDQKPQVKQMLLNIKIRLRERYTMLSLREEQLMRLLAETAAPLRAAAFTILQLQNKKVSSPKEAFAELIKVMHNQSLSELPSIFSRAREGAHLSSSEISAAIFSTMQLIEEMLQFVK